MLCIVQIVEKDFVRDLQAFAPTAAQICEVEDMEESSVRIDALGRIQTPKDFRKLLGMEIGDTVNLAIVGDRIVVQKNTEIKEGSYEPAY